MSGVSLLPVNVAITVLPSPAISWMFVISAAVGGPLDSGA
jgi:hypothetical protein